MIPHPIVEAAAAGHLPDWAVAGRVRRAHMERVAALLDEWAQDLAMSPADRVRWRAAGHLHDALRDECADALRGLVPAPARSLPAGLLHGPAAAEQLRLAGVRDDELLDAVAFHTTGDASLGGLGRALYAADFLDPGRTFLPEWRAKLRERMPGQMHTVLPEIVRARVENLLARGRPVLPETLAFRNALESARR